MSIFSKAFLITSVLMLVAVVGPAVSQSPLNGQNSQYGSNQNPQAGSSGNSANASAVATLPAPSGGMVGKTAYVTGFQITSDGATTASCVNATLAGVIGGPLLYTFCAPGTVQNESYPLAVHFNPALPASAPNTAITITLPALGSGNTLAVTNIQGYWQ